MQTRFSHENSVRPPARPSVKRKNSDQREEKSVQIFIPYKRTFSQVFWQKEWLVGATTSTWLSIGKFTDLDALE